MKTINTVKQNRVVRIFNDSNLGNGHKGLANIAKTNRINVLNLNIGEYVVFVNRNKTAMKMYAPGNVVAHMKMPKGMIIDMRIIALLPTFFNGTEINYFGALKKNITKQFPLSIVNNLSL